VIAHFFHFLNLTLFDFFLPTSLIVPNLLHAVVFFAQMGALLCLSLFIYGLDRLNNFILPGLAESVPGSIVPCFLQQVVVTATGIS